MRNTTPLHILTYVVLVLLAVTFLVIAYVFPASELVKTILVAPGAAAALGIVVQILRDERAYEKARESKDRELSFTLAIVSHMAQVVFNKEVEFCEKYAEAVNATVMELLREGPTPKALDRATLLSQLRDKYSLWVPKESYEKLYEFERALRQIGSNAMMASVRGEMERMAFIDKTFNMLENVLGIQPRSGENKPEVAAASINEYLKEILGAADYVILRRYVLNEAIRITGTSHSKAKPNGS